MSTRDLDRMTTAGEIARFDQATDETLAELIRLSRRVPDDGPPTPAPIPLMRDNGQIDWGFARGDGSDISETISS
jgi:hypothetical protein